jgi:hypothetical protein
MLGSGQTEKKARQAECKVESTTIIFFDIKGIVHKEFVLGGQRVSSTHYSDVLQ